MILLFLVLVGLNIGGFALFSYVFENADTHNMYLTYFLIGVQVSINVLFAVLMVLCFFERKESKELT